MQNAIELNGDNINIIKYNEVVAVTIAEGGAMGETNGFYVILKNTNLYHTNFGQMQISKEKLFETFPLLKTFNCFCGEVVKLDEEWKSFYMGFGNYLIVRKEYFDIVNKYIKDSLPENYHEGSLYQKWYEIMIKVI